MKTHTTILAIYRRLRRSPVSMLVGRAAESALSDARTIVRFGELQSLGLVRISSEPESENYFDAFGKEDNERDQKRMEATLERMGCYCVSSEYYDGETWQHADSIGMCVYDNPASPFENCYVSELMRAAIDRAEAVAREPAERAYWEARDVATV